MCDNVKKEQISSIYIDGGFLSYLKGYWDFVSSKNKNSNSSKGVTNFFVTIVLPIAVICGIVLTIHYFELFLINHTSIFVDKYDHKPERFDPANGDYCDEDENGKIIKCMSKVPNMEMHMLSVLFLILLLLALALTAFGIGPLLFYILKYLFGTTCNFIKSIGVSFSEYNIYRKDVKEKVTKDLVNIV